MGWGFVLTDFCCFGELDDLAGIKGASSGKDEADPAHQREQVQIGGTKHFRAQHDGYQRNAGHCQRADAVTAHQATDDTHNGTGETPTEEILNMPKRWKNGDVQQFLMIERKNCANMWKEINAIKG